ncbi:dockerin type I repeat-containing protein [Patescibacteria group bacterium]|nr:dockerin type I repeat-containing protein [Patescibacteria group bacterium]
MSNHLNSSNYNFKLIYLIIPLIVLVAGYSFVSAQASKQVTVTAVVPEKPPLEEPDTIIIFSGIAYPSSTVTISRDASVISVITTNSQAQFQVQATVDPGTYTFTIVGIDSDGIEGKISNFTLTLSEGTTTTISGIFLGPTITIDNTSIGPGETTTLNGTTVPSSEVNVTLNYTAAAAAAGDPHIAVHIASADSNGRWLQLFNTDDLSVGSYDANAQAIEPENQSVSETSKTVSFDVVTGEEEPDECDGMVPGDLNCDGYVNLVDFSILLFYWNSTDPANPRADINSDGLVEIIDFSIMLYYWTG